MDEPLPELPLELLEPPLVPLLLPAAAGCLVGLSDFFSEPPADFSVVDDASAVFFSDVPEPLSALAPEPAPDLASARLSVR